MLRRLGFALAFFAGLAGPAEADPQSEEAALDMLVRAIVLGRKCPRVRLNYVALGFIVQRWGLTRETLEAGGKHHGRVVAGLDRLEVAFGAATADEACALVFELYGAKGSDARGLVVEADPNDFFAFVDALGRGFGTLRKIIDTLPRDTPK